MSIIQNSEMVVAIFGYWPHFCDGKILQFRFEKGEAIELTVSYIDTALGKRAVVVMSFTKVSEIELYERRAENILDNLIIKSSAHSLDVELEACSGLHGTFSCGKAEVVSISCDDVEVVHVAT